MVLYILLTYAYKYLKIYTKIVILLVFAIQIEIVQYFIPNRTFSLHDIFADSIGIAIGIFTIFTFRKLIIKIKY